MMKVLRSNKDSVMAMLEAFVHDPLINWRLLNTTDTVPDAAMARDADASPDLPTKTSGEKALHLASKDPQLMRGTYYLRLRGSL